MRRITLLITALIVTFMLLTGCMTLGEDVKDLPSIANSGTTSVEVRPVFAKPGEAQVGIEYKAMFAKAYDDFSASLTFDDDGNITGLNVSAGGVKAFEGQKSAHEALVAIRNDITTQNIAISAATLNTINTLIKSLAPLTVP